MDIMKKAYLALLLTTSAIAQAETNLGIIAAKSGSLYKDTDSESTFLPNLSYESDHFFLRLPEVGYRFFPKQSPQNIAIGLSYESTGFDPDDSDNANIRQLDDRDASIMAFASYQLGPVTTKVAQDVSGEHDGYYAQISAGYPIPLGSWRVIPSIAYRYMDSKMSNHLFGVSQAESDRTGGAINAYDTEAVSSIRYGVRGVYSLSDNVNLLLGISHTQFDDKILKSPIIEDNSITSLLAGVSVSF
jgi:outer membrane protein